MALLAAYCCDKQCCNSQTTMATIQACTHTRSCRNILMVTSITTMLLLPDKHAGLHYYYYCLVEYNHNNLQSMYHHPDHNQQLLRS